MNHNSKTDDLKSTICIPQSMQWLFVIFLHDGRFAFEVDVLFNIPCNILYIYNRESIR